MLRRGHGALFWRVISWDLVKNCAGAECAGWCVVLACRLIPFKKNLWLDLPKVLFDSMG